MILFAFLLGLIRASGALAQEPRIDVAQIDRLLQAQVDSGFSGVALLATGDSIALLRAYDRSATLTPRSAFWIASITKGFTAVAVLKLVEEKRLTLSDSLGALLPDVPADKKGITIHQLLTHTAGLGGNYANLGVTSRSDAIQAILAPALEHRPGDGYRYSNNNYELLAAIIEVVSGVPWERNVTDAELIPMHLANTGFGCRNSSSGTLPPETEGENSSPCPAGDPSDWAHRGANGMWSTAGDLFRWARSLSSGHEIDDQVRAAIATPQVEVRREGDTDVSYGYGVRVYTRDGRVVEVTHSGFGDSGHSGVVRLFPSGVTVLVLSNAGEHGGTTWSSYVARQIVEEIGPASTR
ncbi:MAG TPA: serine hydrolase domain-containing protein [Gemmatimonadales bacterium]